jgi:ABC-type nitrate/sulfonate/bicarbonate transport system permease component
MGSTEGLGFLINVSANTFQTAKLLAGIVVLALITITIVELLKWIQRKTVPWWEIRSDTKGF